MGEREDLIKSLELGTHPEGGKFIQLYRSNKEVKIVNEEVSDDAPRIAATGIYYMLQDAQIISWHTIKSDELFFWHRGSPVKVHELLPDGSYRCRTLGDPIVNPGAQFQMNVTPGNWFALELEDKAGYTLYSCVVIPGFDMKDWCEGTKDELLKLYPQHSDVVVRLCKS